MIKSKIGRQYRYSPTNLNVSKNSGLSSKPILTELLETGFYTASNELNILRYIEERCLDSEVCDCGTGKTDGDDLWSRTFVEIAWWVLFFWCELNWREWWLVVNLPQYVAFCKFLVGGWLWNFWNVCKICPSNQVFWLKLLMTHPMIVIFSQQEHPFGKSWGL